MTFRLADRADLPWIMAVVARSVEVMQAEGSDQWDEVYPDEAAFAADIAAGDLYIAQADGQPLGFMACTLAQPAEYGPLDWTEGVVPLGVHRVAVAPEARRRGVARALLTHSETVAAQRQCGSVRVDTYRINAGMRHLLIQLGYRYVGDLSFVGFDKKETFVAYEKLL